MSDRRRLTRIMPLAKQPFEVDQRKTLPRGERREEKREI